MSKNPRHAADKGVIMSRSQTLALIACLVLVGSSTGVDAQQAATSWVAARPVVSRARDAAPTSGVPTTTSAGLARRVPTREFSIPGTVGAATPRTTQIIGYAWTANNQPIPEAMVRLRDMTTGRVAAIATANASGEFAFESSHGGTFVLELVGENDSLLAVGEAFTIEPGETVATFVRLPLRLPIIGGLVNQTVSNVATAAVSTAATEGVTAMVPPSEVVSAEY